MTTFNSIKIGSTFGFNFFEFRIMASLNLPGALDDSVGDEIPGVLLSKAAGVRNEGGAEKIEQLLNSLPDVMTRNSEILNEVIY